MKFMTILLLVAASHAVDLQNSRSKQKKEGERNEKREFAEGNSIDKRAPVISTVSPAITPGVEYADSKETQRDTSPTRQIYATPLPPVSKISDVLTGQGPPFQSAIASHLYAPISVYQPRFGAPTTYEVSAPVPSNLAYTEHRVSLQPSQNALQYSPKPIQKSKNSPQVFVQQLAYPQTLGPVGQPIYQQIPFPYSEGPINNFQAPSYPVHQGVYQDQPVQIIQSVQPGVTYQETSQENQQTQKEIKPQPARKETEKQATTQNHVQPQGAVSFARYSQLQSIPTHQPQQEQNQYQLTQQQQPHYQPQSQPQPQYQLQEQQPQYQQQQIQYQPQPAQYQPQAQPQYHQLVQPQIQYQPLPRYNLVPQFEQPQQFQQSLLYEAPQPEQVHQQSQQQIQYQPQQHQQQQYQQQQHQQQQYQHQPQQLLQPQPQPQPQLPPAPKPSIPTKQISYLRPGPVFLQSQFPQNHGSPDYRSNVALPTFPPVQYFGKYAQSIFGNHQH